MSRALLLVVALSGCYRHNTEDFYESSRCGGTYHVVTTCDAVVGPWPTMTVNYRDCYTRAPP